MQQYRKNLGKVSLTAEGAWNLNNSYDILGIVYDEHTQHGFISRKAVPQGVDLYNKEYWMPLNVSGYADNNVIILSKKTSEASIQSYTLEEAITSIKSVGRRPGAILGFYNENNDRLDIGGRWELWQFNDTNVYNWENVDSWQNLYYNYNKFMGWFKDENFLTKYAPFPEIGCYAFVGSEFNEAVVYRCDNKYVWNNTAQHAWDYVKVIVDGNVTVGENGNWFNNGEDTGIPASVKGKNGKTPVFREKDNTIQYSFDNVNWITISDKVAAWFRWNATTGDTQANNVGRIQISRDNITWTNLSGDIINNLHISRYIGADESLPTSGIAEGTIYAKGPTYADGDTSHTNPIYRLWVYAWKGNTLAWQDNGEFTSIAAGIVQEIGDSETEVMSQKAVTEKLSELGSGGVIRLAYRAISNIVANLEMGDYGWNDSTNQLIKKTSSSGEYEIYNPNINSGVYIYNSAYYRFNGSGLEVFAVKDNILNSIILESGAVDSVGNLKDNSKRVRSAYSIEGNFNIYVPNPSMVVYAIVYYKNNGTFDSYVQVNDRFSTNIGKEDCVAKVVFAHKDLSTEITPNDVKNAASIELLKSRLDNSELRPSIHDFAWEQGSLDIANGSSTINVNRLRNQGYLYGIFDLTLPNNLQFLNVLYYDAITKEYLDYDNTVAGLSFAHIGREGCVSKIAISKREGGQITIEDLKHSIALDIACAEITRKPPLVEFTYDYILKDVAKYTEGFTIRWAETTVMDQVYEKFDDLVKNYSSYISKVDAVELVGLEYPSYSKLEGAASGNYLATPSYKTYLYKLVDDNPYVGNDVTGVNKKRKLFIVGGTHGIEVANCVNLYIFAKMLCEGVDENYFKLRESFDIYILPCLNGYGIYHGTRVNANGVDINRNYPSRNWAISGSLGSVDYSGDVAGSEFETQLIMALTSNISPDIAIDHHNYWPNLKWQFYTNVKREEYIPLLYQSLVDCSFAFIKGLPSYFGEKVKLFVENSGSSINGIRENNGTTLAWWDENGVKISSTLEVCCAIGYMNGIHVIGDEGYDYYGNDTFSVAEYTLRNQIIRFCDYVLRKL